MAAPEPPPPFRSLIRTTPLLPPRRKAEAMLARELFSHLRETQLEAARAVLSDPASRDLVAGVVAHAPYLAQILRRDPGLLGQIAEADPAGVLEAWRHEALDGCAQAGDMAGVMGQLRRYKARAALLLALCECGGVWPVERSTEALSDVADAAVQAAVDHILRGLAARGVYAPADPDHPGEGSGLIVLALGKHGARELNYSSDIDIVLFYDPAIAMARGLAEPQAAFVRLARDLSRMLQERTAEGYVFRVDLRLRPDPASTQAAVSTEAAYAYYESVGQNWERAAFIKARPIAGDIARGEAFLGELAPFIWRKYFDFAAIADIHAMKRQIQAVKGHEAIAVAGHDVKLGRGGIREIEFFVQTQQLVFGGRRPGLRGRRTLDMLVALHQEGWITARACDELSEAYRWLRLIEHRLQMRHDEQTQRLPADRAELEAFARFAGFPSAARFADAFTAQARRVEAHYALLFEEGPSLAAEAGSLSFTGADHDPPTLETLARIGFRAPEQASEIIRGWHFGRRPAVTSARAREALTELTPALLVAFGRSGDPDAALNALDQAFGKLPAAVELLSMLRRHERLLALFASLLGSAPRLARIVAANPHVLDGVIDPAFAEADTESTPIAARLRAAFGHPASFEEALDRLRDVARQENFLIGARLVSGVDAPRMAGLAYAKVADAVVALALEAAEAALASVHGVPCGIRVCVLGLGRLGQRDLTATSDLDLVIVYDAPDFEARSAGDKPLDAVTWAQRLAQRLVTALTAPTRRGLLYEVDLRLRPSGRSGPMAVRLASFAAYQREEAELWEHMALTKARVVAGDHALGAEVMAVVRAVLTTPRDAARVHRDVRAMRARIAEAKGDSAIWDLKLAKGGLTDIDFIAEALVLAHSAARPALVSLDTATILREGQAAGLLSPAQAVTLIEAQALFNAVTHWQRLAVEGPFDPLAVPAPVNRLIAGAGHAPDLSRLAALLAERRAEVRATYDELLK